MTSLWHALSVGWHDTWRHLSSWAHAIANSGGAWVVLVLILAASALLAYGIVLLATKPGSELKRVLEPYQLRQEEHVATPAGSEVVTLPALRRVADWFSGVLEKRGLRPILEKKLLRAGLPIGPGEFALLGLAELFVVAIFGLAIGGLTGLILAAALGVLLPFGVLQALVDRRARRFDAQLPDVLQLLSGSLKAGFSLAQGLDAVVEDVKAPMDKELRRALAAARLGLPLEEALDETAERIGSRDFSWTVMAIRIQREVGGNLAEILDTVAHTMIQRTRLRREVRTLTAEGRISAIILAVMPILIGLFISVVNRPYLKQLTATGAGQIALVGGIVLELFGAWWLYRTVQIEV